MLPSFTLMEGFSFVNAVTILRSASPRPGSVQCQVASSISTGTPAPRADPGHGAMATSKIAITVPVLRNHCRVIIHASLCVFQVTPLVDLTSLNSKLAPRYRCARRMASAT